MKKLYRKGSVHPSPPLISDQLSFLPATILTLAAALTVEDREVLAYLISCSAANNNNNYIFAPTTTTATNSKKNRSGSSQTAPPPPPPPPQDDVQRNKNKRKINVNNNGGKSSGGGGTEEVVDHPASFDCNCFRCYMSYWIRWDSSPNRQLIHEIIDAYEDKLLSAAAAAAANNNNNSNNSNTHSKMSRRERKKRGGKKNGGSSSSSAGGVMDRNPELGSGQDELVRTAEPAAEGGDRDGEDGGVEEMVEKGSVRKIVSFIGEKIWNVWG